jgi:hypothetical protein
MTLAAITNGTRYTEQMGADVDRVAKDVERHIPKTGLGISNDEKIMTTK